MLIQNPLDQELRCVVDGKEIVLGPKQATEVTEQAGRQLLDKWQFLTKTEVSDEVVGAVPEKVPEKKTAKKGPGKLK